MRCEHCNTEIADDSKFCYKCGKTIIQNQTFTEQSVHQSLIGQDDKQKKSKKILSICAISVALLVIVMMIANYYTQTRPVKKFTEAMLSEINSGSYQNAMDLYIQSVQELPQKAMSKNNSRERIDALYNYACFMRSLYDITPQEMYEGDLSGVLQSQSLCQQSLLYLNDNANANFQTIVEAFENPKMSIEGISAVVDDYYEKSFALLKLKMDVYDAIYNKLRPIYEDGEPYSIDKLVALQDDVYVLIDNNKSQIIAFRYAYADICQYDAFPTKVEYDLADPFHAKFSVETINNNYEEDRCFAEEIEYAPFDYTHGLELYAVLEEYDRNKGEFDYINSAMEEYVEQQEQWMKRQFNDYSSDQSYYMEKKWDLNGDLPGDLIIFYQNNKRSELIDYYNQLMTSWASGTFEEKDQLMLWIYYNQNWVSAQKQLDAIHGTKINVR